MPTLDLHAYARRGAQTRIVELQQELEAIFATFPDLRPARRGRPKGNGAVIAAGSVRGRKGMSAAQRREVSRRMKKYWAQRRAKKSPVRATTASRA